MTLELKLTSISGFKGAQFIYVKGGQSGILRLSARRLPQLIRCSSNDHLTFLICGKDSELQPHDVLSTIDFYAQATLDANRIALRTENSAQFNVRGYDQKDQKLGELTFSLTFDRKKLYTGEMVGAEKKRVNYLPFYRGKCPSYNLYNSLDKHSQKSKYVWLEDIYRDA